MPLTPTGPRTRLAALVAAGGLLLSACTGGPDLSSGEEGFVTSDLSVEVLPEADRATLRGEVAGETVEGTSVSLADYDGKVVVMPVWGAWCGPCRKEAPGLALAARDLEDDGVAFLGINTRDRDPDAVRAFLDRYDIPYDSIFDEDGRTLLAFRGTLPPMAIPSFVFIDDQGRIAARILGPSSLSTLYGVLEDLTGKELTVPREDAGAA